MPDGLLRGWVEPGPVEVSPEFQAAIGGHPLVAQVLTRRGLGSLEAARAFLDPRVYQPCPAESLPGLPEACRRIEQALAGGEQVCVWGDFDVDGQTATTLLVSTLRGLLPEDRRAAVSYHIPVRSRETHGVNWERLQPILDGGASLVVTCDTGISSVEALRQARLRGVDVIVTDHHDLPAQLPEAAAIVNPKLLPAGHPLGGLPGVGVAYKLAEALYRRAGREEEAAALLDLAALGIVADLAHQTDDTRHLLQRGLWALRETPRAGLAMMIELAGLQQSNLTEEHIGFVLGPRLNALGRLDDANPAVELLTTADPGRARVLATHLEGLNARRRLLTAQVLGGALAQIERDPSLLEQAALVIEHPEWPAGVIGIVASELAERFNRPTVLLAAPPGEPARGSARSVEGVNVTAAIAAQERLLLNHGGHPMAAGLSLERENIPAFRRGLSRAVEAALGGAVPRRSLQLDGSLGLEELSLNLVADLERLAPFGAGNPPLALAIPRLSILSKSTIGRDGDHLQLVVKDEFDRTQRVVWWRGAGWPLPEGVFDLACTVRTSNYRGQREVQVEWIDARPVDGGEIDLRRPLAVIDQRDLDHPLPVLQAILSESPAVVWAEAEAIQRLAAAGAGIPAADRAHLSPAETLIVWTTPPGRAELQAAIEAVGAQNVVVFAVDPADATPEAFLRRLAGLAKYTLEKHGGQVDLPRLAAASAQRETAVRLGLKWLAQRGLLEVSFGDGTVQLSPGGVSGPGQAAQTLEQLKILMEEVSAYRQYFKTAEKEHLL
jgi:single-stranded-DNA-specific exonuclease